MSFKYSRNNLSKKEKRRQRVLEKIPGLLSWLMLLGVPALSVLSPFWAAIVIIAFMLYWLLRIFYLTLFLVLSYFRLECEKMTDWQSRIDSIDQGVNLKVYQRGLKGRLSEWFLSEEIKLFKKSAVAPISSKDIYHLVIVPVANESGKIIAESIKGLLNSHFATKQMIPCLALEDSLDREARDIAFGLQEQYKSHFKDFFVIVHPKDIEGEARVKGANATYAAKEAAKYFTEHEIPYDNVIVSCFDVDTIADQNYFACLTYSFMIHPDRQRASYQPIPVFYNNIWEVPGFARILEMGASFFELIEVTNPEKLVTFSSHSMSFKALTEIGYWPVDMISDDSAVFWKALLHYDGQYCVTPIYVTVSMDVTKGENIWETITNLYKQKRRWAWGVENFPIVMRGFMNNKNISLRVKLRHSIKMIEGNLSWATLPYLMILVGWLPALWSNNAFADTAFYYGSKRVVSTIFTLSEIALVTTILVSVSLLPKKKSQYSFFWKILHALEWLLLPLVFIIFSATPALESQTRLMLGQYMGFWVAKKRSS